MPYMLTSVWSLPNTQTPEKGLINFDGNFAQLVPRALHSWSEQLTEEQGITSGIAMLEKEPVHGSIPAQGLLDHQRLFPLLSSLKA